jgi:branched-chain amino acid transport system ATP-binding protein
MLPKSINRNKLMPFEEKVNMVINKCFLQDVQFSLAGEISYGQQKLLNLACCVANDANLLLLDEPVAGINPAYRDKIAVIVKELKNNGKTILLIEHNTEFINDVTDRIFFLSNGEVTQYKDLETMKVDASVLAAYM